MIDSQCVSALLQKCVEKEKGVLVENTVAIHSRLGVLITSNDEVIEALAKTKVCVPTLLSTHVRQLVHVMHVSSDNSQLFNLVIVPDMLIHMWRSKSTKELSVVFTNREIDEAFDSNTIGIVLSESMYRRKQNIIYRRRFQKVILYNVCAYIRTIDTLDADFYWFVHSTLEKATILSALPARIAKTVLVQDDERCLRHKEPFRIVSTAPSALTMSALVQQVVQNDLDPVDVTRSLHHITHKSKRDRESIVNHMLRFVNDSIGNIDAQIHTLEHGSEQDKESLCTRINDLVRKRERARAHRNDILNRVNRNMSTEDTCFICYSNVENPCVMRCCSNRVCFTCIHKWFERCKRCPLCNYEDANVFVIEESVELRRCYIDNVQDYEHTASMIENVCVLIRRLRTTEARGVLIASTSCTFARQIEKANKELSSPEFCNLLRPSTLNNTISQISNNKERFFVIVHELDRYPFPISIPNVTDIVYLNGVSAEARDMLKSTHGSCKNEWLFEFAK